MTKDAVQDRLTSSKRHANIFSRTIIQRFKQKYQNGYISEAGHFNAVSLYDSCRYEARWTKMQ